MMQYENYKNYLRDNIYIIVEKIHELMQQDKKDDFIKGQLMAYYDIVDLFKQQSEFFDIDIAEIGLNNINECDIFKIYNDEK
ncbi:hypothetical protein [Campylobacter sputorum]|uniref:hypothetical protein n=1 Tax=Campylobacter sputorum TaxID=206 RepID=UPI00053BFED5|nr:hypothetical protein [Campylobacter sputorum]